LLCPENGFTDILDDTNGEMIPSKKVIGSSKEQRKYMG
jgi:hypothetical protein